ncbi:Acetyl-/propionyl-coenzyme A carboxylase alpha chain [Pelagimonas phthalicica]|uniref:Acetyl-/propionyl-coenzyme A carboxylase alpha chain n=1 Tax=Pelagimonas phthalicica TaxID=1037362 RepID=A0A238JDU8_9RHOB|nr:acetyl/propionyl/methylcrotonyl-CoA carboxylase subunit alpha [Pelagimonas phthalicica]TDS91514.1 3-methylcrotonyl-CoA carboxylase alpha subunit [Pelagimonas phthalicica]SMX28563.1 Acetyl-/propionyl-coenzyme A carboxylase alpha chain [Pelagimonas phthalicica]
MIDTILIANRGEIACRVIETARKMGMRCVAVHSDVDADAKHVAMADVAVCIGEAAPAQSYLRGDRIIAAAQQTGAQLIHPGYGFLSENPDFVDQVEEAGLTFVGPSAKAIRAMGLKDAAKKLMQEAGVPVVPGYMGEDQDPGHLEVEAQAIGYPVLIKAVAGGGGKGMRLVERPEDFADALVSAQSEARTAFGNDHVLIEKYISKPRHIEVQVFGDGTQAVHLFERDCSLQRRHQKVIEEAPAPDMPETVRDAMGAAAVRAAEAIGYKGAGTVEFIVDGSQGLREDGFWFMEMNTRLQVEHPVSELITGVDLVEWQIRVACGEPLPAQQSDLSINGHAFEARLYAEDVPAGFLPATGRLTHLQFPAGVRADSGVRAGDEISPNYDPMIAKLIVHGPTRAVALRQLAKGLRDTEVAGTVTNLSFLGALAEHEGFGRGDVDTGLIARDLDALVTVPQSMGQARAMAALVASGLMGEIGAETGFSLWDGLLRTIWIEEAGERHEIKLQMMGADRCSILDGEQKVEAVRTASGWTFDGQKAPNYAQTGNVITIFADYGRSFHVVDLLDQADQSAVDATLTLAPMPGRVVSVHVSSGQEVAEGDRLVVLEAMKMEHTMVAGRAGRIAELLVDAGDQVEAGAPLVRLEDEESA